MIRLRAGQLALLLTSLLSLLVVTAGSAGAATPEPTYKDAMTFIGDSVTAGFGYCGTAETPDVTCSVNGEMENNWKYGKTSLKKCAPKDAPAVPDDACSNNNVNGKPWLAEPWKAGPNAPDTAYPFQIAARQTGSEAAAVSDWAVTGSTPADWDPNGGSFGFLLDRLKNQYVGMTVGANPLLSYFTNIAVANFDQATGPCVKATGYMTSGHSVGGRSPVYIPGRWYSGTIDNTLDCLRREWNRIDQTQHLVNIYTTLLSQGDRVVVMGYYRNCNWSFGNWQPNGNVFGTNYGNSCRDLDRRISPDNAGRVTQWDQAIAVGKELNNLIQDAVTKAKAQAKSEWPETNRDDNLVFTTPDESLWDQHQPKSDKGSWVLLNDTWIHPNKAGAANLADTVTDAMCTHFAHWCGSRTTWNQQ